MAKRLDRFQRGVLRDMQRTGKTLLPTALVLMLLAGCVTRTEMKANRAQLISILQHEMATNSKWLRIHAAEGLLDNGESTKIVDLFRDEAATATPPYRIGVWRVLARATNGAERDDYIQRIRQAMMDPLAIDRISAAESLGKLDAASRSDREFIAQWLKTADDATAPFPCWLQVLSSNESERSIDEARLVQLLTSSDPVARLRAAFALGRLKQLLPESISKIRAQLKHEAPDSIARIYLITALLLHLKDESVADLENEIIAYAKGKANEQLELGIVSGLLGRREIVPVLRALLNNPEADARIGAANGLLRLTR